MGIRRWIQYQVCHWGACNHNWDNNKQHSPHCNPLQTVIFLLNQRTVSAIIVIIFNLMNIRMLHCRYINNGGVKIWVTFSVDEGRSGYKIILTLFVGGFN